MKASKSLKALQTKTQSTLRTYKRSKGKAAKHKARKAYMSAHARYASACRTGERRARIDEVITILGVQIHVIQKGREYFFLGDFVNKIDARISEALAARYNLESVDDVHVFEKKADLNLAAEIVRVA